MKNAIQLIALAIAIPIAILFGPALFSERSFAFRDAGHFYYPLFQWCWREWAAGRVPLWNPNENCGVPVLADVTASVFYPGQLLFLFPLEFAVGFKMYTVAHVILAACGSYCLARAWTASQPAAALAAIAYSCGGNVVFQYTNVVFLVGAAWLPFAALAADQMLRNRTWMAAGWLAVVLGLMILGGDPQAAYHALLITALYGIVLTIWPDDELPTRDSKRPCRMRTMLVRIGLFTGAAASAYLLAAVQILPSSEALKLSERAAFNRPRNIYEAATVALQSSDQQPLKETRQQSIIRGLLGEPEDHTHHELAYDFSIGPWRLIEYVWPNISGRMFPTHRRWLSLLPAEGRIWTPTLYMGLLPILLGLSAFRLCAAPARTIWLSLIVLLFTLGAFGAYGVGWLMSELWPTIAKRNPDLNIGSPVGGMYWLMLTLLPDYVYFRYPAKLLPLVSLAISQLAAIGFDRAIAGRSSRLRHGVLALGCGSAVVAMLVWGTGSSSCAHRAQELLARCIGRASLARVEWSDPSFGPFDAIGAYHDVLFALLQTAIVAIVGWWLLSKIASVQISRRVLLVLVTGVEIALANSWLVVTAPLDAWQSEPAIAEAIRSNRPGAASDLDPSPRIFRANLASWRPASFSTMSSLTRPAEIVQWEHDTLFPKHPLASDLGLVESYESVKSADYQCLLAVARQHGPRQRDKSLLPQPSALRMLGTEFLVLPEAHRPDFAERISIDRTRTSEMPEGAALWQLTRTLPRLWIVHDVESTAELPYSRRKEAIEDRTYKTLFPGDRPRTFLQSALIETNNPPLDLDQKPGRQRDLASDAVADYCQLTHYSPQRVVAEADLDRPGLLILSDAWHPGWKAVVTSAGRQTELPIHRTNRILRGIWLPAGTHTVEYRFESRSFQCGALISGISWPVLATGLVGVHCLRRRRVHRRNSSPCL